MTAQRGTASESPNFLIERDSNGYIKVRWTVEIGEVGSLEHKLFLDKIMRITGTEYIRGKRYSASIEIADHVVSAQTYIERLKQVIESSYEGFIAQIV